MPELTIDNQAVNVPAGATILDAAAALGIDIPHLCCVCDCCSHRCSGMGSCMACLVRIDGSPSLTPSCATQAADGMRVQSETPEIHAARKASLELLLSDHLGDCYGPCQMSCPARMDVPRLLRHLAAGEAPQAAALARETLIFPATLGMICPAPCGRACRRGDHDQPLAIGALHYWAATQTDDPNDATPAAERSRRRVAVVGGGPTGLAAAATLTRLGHDCVVYEAQPIAGGQLRRQMPAEHHDVLDREIAAITAQSVTILCDRRLADAAALSRLTDEFDAVLLAPGALDETTLAALRLNLAEINKHEYRLEPYFVAGDLVRPTRLAVRAVAAGREVAESINAHLCGAARQAGRATFNCRIGAIDAEEMQQMLQSASPKERILPPDTVELACGTYSAADITAEATRCLRCDCRKLKSCQLKHYAEIYHAQPKRYPHQRRRLSFNREHPDIIFEVGKCIACGICIKVAAEHDDIGMTLTGRGFDTRLAPPLGQSLADALKHSAPACVRACPTGALAWA